MAKIAFKSDNQKQSLLLPPSLDELIPLTHSVRVVNAMIDRLDVDAILHTYRGGGNSCFHPRQMLKILVYAYLNNIYSSRRIAQQLSENIHYMWLSGGAKPDFRTINYFRGKRLKGTFEELFRQVVELLHKEGFVSLEVQYIDGTKIESAANKYSFVWRSSVEKHDRRLREKTDAVLREIEQVICEEEREPDTEQTLSTEEFASRVERIKEWMDTENLSKQQRRAVRDVERKSLPRMKEYERHIAIMGERNSYARSDPDATFMRMKEDAMLNGQLKPGYKGLRSNPRGLFTTYDGDRKIRVIFPQGKEEVDYHTGREVVRWDKQWFSGNFMIGFKSNMSGGGFHYKNMSFSPAKDVSIIRGRIYGAVKYDNQWRACVIETK